jgi:hypothetical protein
MHDANECSVDQIRNPTTFLQTARSLNVRGTCTTQRAGPINSGELKQDWSVVIGFVVAFLNLPNASG